MKTYLVLILKYLFNKAMIILYFWSIFIWYCLQIIWVHWRFHNITIKLKLIRFWRMSVVWFCQGYWVLFWNAQYWFRVVSKLNFTDIINVIWILPRWFSYMIVIHNSTSKFIFITFINILLQLFDLFCFWIRNSIFSSI